MADGGQIAPVSALAGHLAPRRAGPIGEAGPALHLSERPIGALWQVAAWPGHLGEAGTAVARAAGAAEAPGPGMAVLGAQTVLMRTEPLKWLLLADGPLARPEVAAADGTVLDLGHARTAIRIEGPATADLMARLVPLDLRARSFPEGRVASTGLHHMGVTLYRRSGGIEMLVLRSFALSVWETVLEGATPFGLEIG